MCDGILSLLHNQATVTIKFCIPPKLIGRFDVQYRINIQCLRICSYTFPHINHFTLQLQILVCVSYYSRCSSCWFLLLYMQDSCIQSNHHLLFSCKRHSIHCSDGIFPKQGLDKPAHKAAVCGTAKHQTF